MKTSMAMLFVGTLVVAATAQILNSPVYSETSCSSSSSVCSASWTPEGTYKNGGVIHSDTDGAGPNSYTQRESCYWTLKCEATDEYPTIIQVNGSLDSGNNGKIRAGSNAAGVAQGTSLLTNGFPARYTTRSSTLSLRFDSTAQQAGSGFSLTWECRKACTGGATPAGNYTDGGVLKSDSDGAGPATDSYGDDCFWRLQCKDNEYVRVKSLTGYNYRPSTFRVGGYSSLGSWSNSNVTGDIPANYSQYQSEMTVTWRTNPYYTQEAGWSLDWECINQCSATKTPAGNYTGGGIIHSDTDGKGTTNFLRGDKCDWWLKCGANERVTIYNVTGYRTYWRHDLEVYAPTGSRLRSATSTNNLTLSSSWHGDIYEYSEVRLNFEASTSYTLGSDEDGFSVHWGCEPVQCAATVTAAGNYTDASGKIMSDTDGSGSGVVGTRQECSWNIVCPSTHMVRILNVTQGAVTGHTLNIRTLDNKRTWYVGSTTYTAPRDINTDVGTLAHLGYSEVQVYMRTYASSSSQGFTLHYECVAPTCSASVTAAGNHSGGGVLSSDSDGNGTATSAAGERCLWYLNCAADEFVYIDKMTGSFSTADEAQLYITADRTSEGSTGLSLSGSLSGIQGSTNRNMYSSWLRVFYQQRTEGTPLNAGFSLEWSCKKRCQANATAAGYFALTTRDVQTIKTDSDGKGTDAYQQDEFCDWHVNCTAPDAELWTKSLTGATSYFTDFMAFRNAGSNSYYRQSSQNRSTGDSNWKWRSWGRSEGVFYFRSDSSNFGIDAQGMDLEYFCYSPFCSAVGNSTPGNKTGGGWIATDSDGAGMGTNYSHGEKCDYWLVCPVGETVRIKSLVGNTRNTNERIYAYYNYRRNSRSIYGDLSTSSSFTSWFTNNREVQIKWSSQKNFGDVTHGGWNLTWDCYKPYCSAVQRPEGNYSKPDNNLGWLSTDSDGAGASTYDNGESCKWKLTCPVGETVMIRNIEGRVRSSDDVYLRADGWSVSRSGYLTGRWKNYKTWQRVVSVEWDSAKSNSGTTAERAGFNITWSCYKPTCSIANGDVRNPVAYSNGGVLQSDTDGFGPEKYANWEECKFPLSCPSTSSVFLRDLSVSIGSGDSLAVRTSACGSVINQTITTNYTNADMQVYTADSEVVVEFLTSADDPTYNGFSYTWECKPHACSAVLTPAGTYSGNGTIRSDTDGEGPEKYAWGEKCEWKIRCAANERLWIDAVEGDLEVGDRLSIYPTSGGGRNLYNDITGDVRLWSTGSTGADIRFSMGREGRPGQGFKLDYRCVPYVEIPRVCTVPTASQGLRVGGGVIQSDTDGDGPTEYTNYESCNWELQCPAGQAIVLKNLTGEMYSWDYLRMAVDGRQIWSVNRELANKLPQLPNYSLRQSSGVTLSFTSSFSSITSSTLKRRGFSLEWECVQMRCPSPQSSVLTGGGVIRSDDDGVNATSYGNNVNCDFTLQCGAGGYVYLENATGLINPCSDFIQVTSNNRQRHHLTTTGEMNFGSVNTQQHSVQLSWTSSGNQTTYQGFRFHWRCVGSAVLRIGGANWGQLLGRDCSGRARYNVYAEIRAMVAKALNISSSDFDVQISQDSNGQLVVTVTSTTLAGTEIAASLSAIPAEDFTAVSEASGEAGVTASNDGVTLAGESSGAASTAWMLATVLLAFVALLF